MKRLADLAWLAFFVFLAIAAFSMAVEAVADAWLKVRSVING